MINPLPSINAHLKFALREMCELEHDFTDPRGPEQLPRRIALAQSLRNVASRIQAGDIIPDMERIMREVLG